MCGRTSGSPSSRPRPCRSAPPSPGRPASRRSRPTGAPRRGCAGHRSPPPNRTHRARPRPAAPFAGGTPADPRPPVERGRGLGTALGSDEKTTVTDTVRDELEHRGHDVVLVGPPGGEPIEWAEVGQRVGELVAKGEAETGVLFCWSGTGASIAANKVPGVRAALCTDAATAAGARKWNDANVLVMGLRLTSPEVARELVDAWFVTEPDPSEADNIARLEAVDKLPRRTAA